MGKHCQIAHRGPALMPGGYVASGKGSSQSLRDLESEHLTGRQRPLCAWAELGAQAHHMGSPECGGVGQIEPRRASFLSCPGGS